MNLITTDRIESDLTERGAQFSALELRLPEALPEQEWAAIGRKLFRSQEVIMWWLGDWAAFGARKYGQLKEFAVVNNIDYQKLRNAAWVSQSVELSRRRDNVPYSFFEDIAPLNPREQTKWLDKIAVEKLPRAELRRQIRLSQGECDGLKADGPGISNQGTNLLADFKHWLSNRPDDFWSDLDRVRVWQEELAPLVKFHAWLVGLTTQFHRHD